MELFTNGEVSVYVDGITIRSGGKWTNRGNIRILFTTDAGLVLSVVDAVGSWHTLGIDKWEGRLCHYIKL